jgi:hypothetical protein
MTNACALRGVSVARNIVPVLNARIALQPSLFCDTDSQKMRCDWLQMLARVVPFLFVAMRWIPSKSWHKCGVITRFISAVAVA